MTEVLRLDGLEVHFRVRGGPLDGMSVRGIEARARVVAITRAGASDGLERPQPAATVDAGDSVFVIGQYDDLLGLLQRA